MRNFVLALPILALSACSVIDQPYLPSASGASGGSYGQYDQACPSGACAPGQSYSVANQGYTGANPSHWPDQALVPNYESGGAVHVNPTGYGHNAQHGSQHGQGYGYGQPPHLRGLRGPKRGNFYGTIGGVMHDTDLNSFGLEGRVGYDFGRILGAELEGSIGVIDEKETINDAALGDVQLSSGFDYNVAAFAVARLPLSQRVSVHARGGYDFRSLSVKGTADDGTSGKTTIDLDGFAYGIGAEYALSPRSGLRLDLTSYDNEFGASESVSASYVRKF